jgi:hypothetical protein
MKWPALFNYYINYNSHIFIAQKWDSVYVCLPSVYCIFAFKPIVVY